MVNNKASFLNKGRSIYGCNPVLIPVPFNIYDDLNKRSMNLMDLLDFKKMKEHLALSDLLGLKAIGSILYERLSPELKPFFSNSEDIYGVINVSRQFKGYGHGSASKRIDMNTLSIIKIWEYTINNTDLMDYFISNVKSIYNNVTINYDYYTSYLFNEEITTFEDGKSYKLVLGENMTNPSNIADSSVRSILMKPIFLILKSGSGGDLNVRDNIKTFFSEYVKILYTCMPVQLVSTTTAFKSYINSLI